MFLPAQVQRRGTDLRVRRQQLLRRKSIDISPRVKNLFCHLRLIDEDVPFINLGWLRVLRPASNMMLKRYDGSNLV